MYGGKKSGAILPLELILIIFCELKPFVRIQIKNILPYKYFLIQNNIIEKLIEWK